MCYIVWSLMGSWLKLCFLEICGIYAIGNFQGHSSLDFIVLLKF